MKRLFLALLINSAVLLATTITAQESVEGPSETQTAQCTITSGDVQASAQASITTNLEGVCETHPMMTAFHLLESRLLLELYNVRLALSQIQHPNYSPLEHSQFLFPHVNLNPTLYHEIKAPVKIKTETRKKSPELLEKSFVPRIPSGNSTQVTENPLQSTSTEKVTPSTSSPLFFSLTTPTTITESPTVKNQSQTVLVTPRPQLFPFLRAMPSRKLSSGPRDFEVHKFNNTLLKGKGAQVFTYFWRLENYKAKLTDLQDEDHNSTELYSPVFVIAGYNLRIRVSLNDLNKDMLYLKLEEAPKNVTDHLSNVILETGDDFFQAIDSSTGFRYKLSVLDQSLKKMDLISQEFEDTTTSGFMIPSAAITDTYIKSNMILLKVIIYL